MLAPTDFLKKLPSRFIKKDSYWGVLDQIGVKRAKIAKNYTFLWTIFYPSISFPLSLIKVGTIWYSTYLSIADSGKISLLHPYHLNLYRCGFLLFIFFFIVLERKGSVHLWRVNWIFLQMNIENFFKKGIINFLIFWYISSCYILLLC